MSSVPARRWSVLVFGGKTGYEPNGWAFDPNPAHEGQNVNHVHGRPERFICGTTGRQTGKTVTDALEIDEGMCRPPDEFGAPHVGVLGSDYSKAELSVNMYITMLTETFGRNSYHANMNKHWLVITDPMAGTVGAKLTWMSAEDEYGVVGHTFSKLIVDEAQAVPDTVWFKVRPTIDVRDAPVRVTGTPDITQAQTWFQGMWFRGQDPQEKDYHSFTVASWETPWMSMETILDAKKTLSEAEFRRLYGGEWVNEDGMFFTHWEDAMLDTEPKFDPNRRYVMAVDFAVEDDYNVVLVGDISTKTVVHKERWNKTEPIDTYERIISIWLRFGRPRTIVDNTGLGLPMAKELQNRGMPIIPFNWTSQTKMPTLGRLAADLQHRRLMFPRAWDDLQRELRGFIRKRTPSGMITANAASGFYDDIVMTLALLNELFNRSGGSSRKSFSYIEQGSR